MRDCKPLRPEFLIGAHTRAALIGGGVSPEELAGPLWSRLDRGRYAWAATEPSVMDRILRAVPLLPEGAVIGGWAAAVLHGVSGMDGETGAGSQFPVQISLSRQQTCRRTTGARVFRSDLDPVDRTVVHNIPVTSLERTAFDIGRLDLRAVAPATTRLALDESVAWLDAMLRDTGLDLSSALAYAEARRRRAGAKQASRALHLADGRSASPQESRLRLVWMIEAELPRPLANEALLDHGGHLIAVPDLLDLGSGLVAEYDGGEHAGAERRSRDLIRAETLDRFGLEVVRITSAGLRDRRQTARRLQSGHRRARAAERPPQYVLGGYYRGRRPT